MAPERPSTPTDARARRPTAAAAASIALPALAGAVAVGVAATGAGLLLPGADLSDAATVGVRVGAGLLAVIGLVALTSRWGGAVRVPGSNLGWVLLTAGVLMAGVTALTFGFSDAVISERDTSPTTTTTVERTTTTTERSTTTTTERDRDSGDFPPDELLLVLSYLVVLGVLALVVYAVVRMLGVAATTRWWRSAPPVPVSAADRIDVAAAEAGLEASLAAVTADSSPRDAISDAYARLLAALADAGAGRRAHEAPHEHLGRVLTPLGVRSEPLHRLAELFVLARFSQRPVTGAHRDDAVDALSQALADLRATDARRQATTAGTAAP